jgi:hypothetical protein
MQAWSLRNRILFSTFTVVGVSFALNQGSFVTGEQFVPASAPDIVVARTQGQPGGRDSWIIPEQVGVEGLMGDLPEFAAGLRQNHDAQLPVFK